MGAHTEELRRKYPAVDSLLEQYGEDTLWDYLKQVRHKELPSILPAEDLLDEVKAYLTPLFGVKAATEAAAVIERQRCISTASHHHMAFDWRIVQGALLYEQWLQIHGEKGAIVPIFAVANVNLKSAIYPRGVLLYDCNPMLSPLRIPIFPFRLRRCCVAGLKGISPEMVDSAQDQLAKACYAGTIRPELFDTVSELFETVLRSDAVQAYNHFWQQTAVINELLSQRYHSDRKSRHLWMDLETITAGLLQRDLMREEGIPYQILFHRKLRARILEKLDGVSGCWTGQTGGTHFFWGLDEAGILFPMRLMEQDSQTQLTGRDSLGAEHSIPFTAAQVTDRLRVRSLLPSLFLIFLELYFLRNYTVMGGHFQPAYLNSMKRGLVEATEELGLFEPERAVLRQKESHTILGMAYLLRDRGAERYLVSTAELWAAPVSGAELTQRLQIRMTDAYEQSPL